MGDSSSLFVHPEKNTLAAQVPLILDVFRKCCFADETLASSVLDFFEEYSECMNPPSSLVSHLVDFFARIAADKDNLEPHVRVKAMTFIEWLVTRKAKTVVKLRLLPVVLQVLFDVISSELGLEEEDEDSRDEPAFYALNVLDCIASYVPNDLVFPHLVCVYFIIIIVY
jgi:hypothetical protein